jgi:DNA polymerase-3 subunit epsilon
MDFLAIDFETANADLSSICQVGLVAFKDGEVADTFSTLVDPQDHFDWINVSIHGIDEAAVRGAPTFAQVFPEIARRAAKAVVVSHTLFDRCALDRASARGSLPSIDCQWLDATRIVRRVWSQYAYRGYGLGNLAQEFGIDFNHHDAAEDARATGVVLLRAMRESGMTLDECMVRAFTPLNPEAQAPITRDGNPNGPLAGEVAVFTGALSMLRREAADLAAQAGCEVDAGVTKETTLLIVGDQDVTKLAPGQEKSSKHLKAEALIAKGQPIRILRESDFRALVGIETRRKVKQPQA